MGGMKVLIAGPYNSGGTRLLQCIRMVCKICNIPVTHGSYVTFNSKKANEFEGVYIIKCNELHEMYFNVSLFDYVFVSDFRARRTTASFRHIHEEVFNLCDYEIALQVYHFTSRAYF